MTGVTLLSGCGGPPDKRSTEELLAIGQARLDEIAIPAGWQLSGGKGAWGSQGKLRWTRDYRVNISPDAAGRELKDRIQAAGWKRDGRTCQAGTVVVGMLFAVRDYDLNRPDRAAENLLLLRSRFAFPLTVASVTPSAAKRSLTVDWTLLALCLLVLASAVSVALNV
ncbi:hypothetical protein Q2K19_26145 [Micromonospora soli]|uniref:hypothetical protein n=1 Tax=Micromonospora sp. NBRC 110009 TaxID=3061627 RepID=UPI0026711ED3|nr:hypothetical protein [Micromonospora sp. NBRC 110009]WKT97626.1 hypothetical protein Q2K19_26145 [Micromonospora sp. NBRC 110009]